ncbi:MAG: hypothetical protein HZA53_12855 [Planctomycetes bacterium]|nr:hypothetical protein [Planctomycetota bacterium]
MKTQIRTAEPVRRMLPLLVSIATEVRERTRAAEALKERIEAFGPQKARRRRELDVLWAEYANHQRELRVVQKELERLGWRSVDELPWRVALQNDAGEVLAEGELDRTVFHLRLPRPSRSAG